eukprot:jgi/Galph1/4611/GphlegSOOS_G3248.1
MKFKNLSVFQRLNDLQVLKQKILITLLIVLISRLGIFIPIPGIDYKNFYEMNSHNQFVNFINIFSGGGFATIGIFALGIVPYINASIIIQLITPTVPFLEKLQKEEGDFGRQKINQLIRYVTLLWSIIQGLGMSFWLKRYVLEWNSLFIFQTTLVLTVGSMLMMWFSELITEKGLGNGSSILITINIIIHIQSTFNNTIVTITDIHGNTISWAAAGQVGFKGAKKATPFAAQITAEKAGKQAFENGVRETEVRISGPGAGRETAIRAIKNIGLQISIIKDITSIPHNGCRAPKRRQSVIKNSINQYSKFSIYPLQKGQALTIGNALRRIMLGYLEGIAIVGVRIAGINHEFTTIDGVREDVLDILLNLKQIVFKGDCNESQIGRLKVSGPGVVTASNLELPTSVDLVDLTQYIATIDKNVKLEMEIKIEKGRGYHLVNKKIVENLTDFLKVDAVYMPVKKVMFHIQEEQNINSLLYEKLILEVTTNGSISGKEAIIKASQLFVEMLEPLKEIRVESDNKDDSQEHKKLHQVPIEELHLSVRAYNCLKRANIVSVADLLDYSEEDLLEIKNFGYKSAEEVMQALQKHLGITLPKTKNKT